ncbi:hypothetical protein CCO03_18755 [Comamonas serinivorans]|uniref:DUF1840 domain-containing protein n=1 Tax=Comamonas serinivorans TaxID=1082851 RepID=A0A1Y0ERZ7_9BURK|nr:DUF1840 domain-containing protein [Comamonas serinivorans]ARU06427.1 hypothetical protein CCO03_18755 [Comamonas serinivorans]
MLYKFKSPAGADVIMNQGPAEHILDVIGKGAGAPGIITVEQIPAAISALRAEVARQEQERAAGKAGHHHAGIDDVAVQVAEEQGKAETVLFSQRVTPLIHLLELSLAEGKGVIWGA